MKTKHTPGPWEIRGNMIYGVDNGPGTAPHIADCDRVEDANLIAAAPDLLSALVALLSTVGDKEISEHDMDMTGHDTESCALCMARAAIAKATGLVV